MADELLQMLGALGTSDHDTLVAQFQSVAGCDKDTCHFFLEANNWNIQAAVASFFESGGSAQTFHHELPIVAVEGEGIGVRDGEAVPPGAQFRRGWRVRNLGDRPWPRGCALVLTDGSALGAPQGMPIPSLMPGQEFQITLDQWAPDAPGEYVSAWRMCWYPEHGAAPVFFGEKMWAVTSIVLGARDPRMSADPDDIAMGALSMSMTGYGHDTQPSQADDAME